MGRTHHIPGFQRQIVAALQYLFSFPPMRMYLCGLQYAVRQLTASSLEPHQSVHGCDSTVQAVTFSTTRSLWFIVRPEW